MCFVSVCVCGGGWCCEYHSCLGGRTLFLEKGFAILVKGLELCGFLLSGSLFHSHISLIPGCHMLCSGLCDLHWPNSLGILQFGI